MMESDELLSRLHQLPPIAPGFELSLRVQRQGRRRLRGNARRAPFASFAVAATVIVYLGWALHFTSELYR